MSFNDIETIEKRESVENLLQDLENLLHQKKNENNIESKKTDETLNFEIDSSKYFTFRSDKDLKRFTKKTQSKREVKNNIDKFFDLPKNYTSLNSGLKNLKKNIKKGKMNLLLKNKISKKINTL